VGPCVVVWELGGFGVYVYSYDVYLDRIDVLRLLRRTIVSITPKGGHTFRCDLDLGP
jgi:hypothetical protein